MILDISKYEENRIFILKNGDERIEDRESSEERVVKCI